MTFYKSTRPDGTDFYGGSVDYAAALASGEPLPELSGDGEFPGRGWYHLATVPTECVGMSWPCRLFEVEPVGETFMDNAHPHKIGARSVRVLREIEARRVFGPQGEQVVALIERCLTLSGAEADRLAAARAATWDAAWVAAVALDVARATAWDAARRDAARRDAARRDAARIAAWRAAVALDAARDAAWVAAVALDVARATAWDAARRDAARRDAARRDAARIAAWRAAVALDAARDAAWVAAVALDVARATAWDAALDAARDAARDAAGALLCRDLIGQAPGWDQDAYDLLTGPWRDVIGPIHPDDGDSND